MPRLPPWPPPVPEINFVGGDWTKNTPKVEYPYAQSVYKYFGALDQVENTHFPRRSTATSTSSDRPYPFMVKHLGLNAKGVLDSKTGKFDEASNTIEKVETMRTFDRMADMPKHALKPGSRISFQ